jgi:hypothetical protein
MIYDSLSAGSSRAAPLAATKSLDESCKRHIQSDRIYCLFYGLLTPFASSASVNRWEEY